MLSYVCIEDDGESWNITVWILSWEMNHQKVHMDNNALSGIPTESVYR